jgi:cytochrome b subunit of formate dehydrogenase
MSNALSLNSRSLVVAAFLFCFLIFQPAAAEETCMQCHEVFATPFADTVHGFLDCADCHDCCTDGDHDAESARTGCQTCHDEVMETYAESIHGYARHNGSDEAPDCVACHGSIHALVPGDDPASPVHPARLPETCGACHADPEVARKFKIRFALPLEAYQASIHARALSNGNGSKAASCNHCHGSHEIQKASDPRSHVYHRTVPETCGECHQQVAEAYAASVHGIASRQGVRESPVCTDCHGEHRILSPSEPGSPVYATNLPKMTCERCHNDMRMNEKFGLPTDKVTAYEDSYHGLAMRSGVATVANCASCHGVHNILPSTDPASSIAADNLPTTCGVCHPGATLGKKLGPVHVLATESRFAAVYYIRLGYLWIIAFTIGGMLLHNGLDLFRKLIQPPPRFATARVKPDMRMSRGFRLAHVLMLTSFTVLVWTGFALKYPESWWAAPMLLWEESLGLRGYLHRIAGLVMIGSLLVHAIHLAVDRRARACIAGMMPTLEDLHELKERFRYFFGLRPTPPAAGALGYPEKMEYLALIWGSLLMAATGFVLWFNNLTMRWLPAWASDVSTTIHFYEAILATASIVVWHFYFVIFDPVVYPMDTTWLTGQSPVARVKEREGYSLDPEADEGPTEGTPESGPDEEKRAAAP